MVLPMHVGPPSDQVVIDRDHLYSLMIRAGFLPSTSPSSAAMMQIPQAEYDCLVRETMEYYTLRKNLLCNGMDLASINFWAQTRPANLGPDGQALSSNDMNYNSSYGLYQTLNQPNFGNTTACKVPKSPSTSTSASMPRSQTRSTPVTSENFSSSERSVPLPVEETRDPSRKGARVHRVDSQQDKKTASPDVGPGDAEPRSEHGIALNGQRTLLISGVSPWTTVKDVLAHVRGGMLIDVYARYDHSVQVSFLRGSDAQAFRNYARRHDVYINNKRVDVDWADRQFRLYEPMAKSIKKGASRILVLHDAAHVLTEKRIRDDMDHIHNLVIIDVKYRDNDIIIHTNSVRFAGYARSCMTTRMPYKNVKIEYLADECAAPLPGGTSHTLFTPAQQTPKQNLESKMSTNLFEVLNDEGTEDGTDDDGVSRHYKQRCGSPLSSCTTDSNLARSCDSDGFSRF